MVATWFGMATHKPKDSSIVYCDSIVIRGIPTPHYINQQIEFAKERLSAVGGETPALEFFANCFQLPRTWFERLFDLEARWQVKLIAKKPRPKAPTEGEKYE